MDNPSITFAPPHADEGIASIEQSSHGLGSWRITRGTDLGGRGDFQVFAKKCQRKPILARPRIKVFLFRPGEVRNLGKIMLLEKVPFPIWEIMT